MSQKLIRPGLTAVTAAARGLIAAGWQYDSTTELSDSTGRTMLHPSGREITAVTSRDGDSTDLTLTGLSLEQVAGAVTGAGLTAPAEPTPDHYLVRGWTGGPGECGVECACGLTYAGFDTVGEPSRLLDQHVAALAGRTAPSYMSCPRECGVDVREHNSSDLVDGRCDTDADPRHLALKAVMAGIAAGLPIPNTIYMPIGRAHLDLKTADNDPAAVDAWVAHFKLSEPKLGPVITSPHRDFQSYNSEGLGWPLADWSYGVKSFVDAPAPADPEATELERLRAEVAELRAQQAGGAR